MSLNAFWMKWKGRTVNSLRIRGVPGTVKHAIVICKLLLIHRWKLYFVWSPWNPWYCYLDKRFDRRVAVDTAGVSILPEHRADSRFNGYSARPHSFFFRLLSQVDVDCSNSTFIDFGCGKSKVFLLAAQLPFRQIIGVELSSKLICIAEEDLRSYRGKRGCKTIQLACTDVRDFHIPRSVLYITSSILSAQN